MRLSVRKLLAALFYLFIPVCALAGKEPLVAVFTADTRPEELRAPSAAWITGRLSDSRLVDAGELCDPARFNRERYPLLILPAGAVLTESCAAAVFAYARDGGSIMTVSGMPFAGAGETLAADLGLKFYNSGERRGVVVKTGSIVIPGKPTKGNVFPYRVPRRAYFQASRLDPSFEGFDVLLVKQPGNPYSPSGEPAGKWCFVTGEGGGNPLDPADSEASSRFQSLVRYLRYPLCIERVETGYATYDPRESVSYSLLLSRNGSAPCPFTVEFSILDPEGKEVFREYRRGVSGGRSSRLTLRGRWRQPRRPGFYRVRALLKDGARVLDLEENGFIVRENGDWGNGPVLGVRGASFTVDGRPAALVGVNYYESTRGELNWLRPDLLRMRGDFRAMKEAGLNYVRIHYIHSKWFRDYFRRTGIPRDKEYFSFADTSPLPSERSLRILDAVILLAREQGLVACFDIFSLVPEEMGDPIGWLGMSERIHDREKVAWQRAFVRMIARRYRGAGNVTWDLWNEPRLHGRERELLREWAKVIAAEFRKNGNTGLITVGDDDSTDMLDVLDYACLHGSDIGEVRRGLGKPVMFQELWNEAGWSSEEESRQAIKIRRDFAAFVSSGLSGFAPWQWTGQARLWNFNPDERWDDELGMCVRDDGSERPAGAAYREALAGYLRTRREEDR